MKIREKMIENYYYVKPVIPRSLQVHLRRLYVSRRRTKYSNVWPIDEKAGKLPEGWCGWPNEKRFALVLLHDVDTAKGQDRCYELMDMEESKGFRSSFNFVPERYETSPGIRYDLFQRGFEVGVHGLKHDGRLFISRKGFRDQALRINNYLKEWQSKGFVSPSMICKLDWLHELAIEYDTSSFDTDPFEPRSEGTGTIFPFWQADGNSRKGFVELPYTLPQDFTLFVLMKEKNIEIWKKKLDWIVEKGGMVLVISHPDYMDHENDRGGVEEYPVRFYEEFLDHVRRKYEGQYWHPLPKEMARFWKEKMVSP